MESNPQIHLLIGDVRLFSRAEKKTGTKLPVRIADGIAAKSIEPLISLLTAEHAKKIRITAPAGKRLWGSLKRGPLITLRPGRVTPRASTRSVLALVTDPAHFGDESRTDNESRITDECRYALAIGATRLAEGDESQWGIAEGRLKQIWKMLSTAIDQIETTRRYLASLDLPRAYAESERELARISLGITESCRALESISPDSAAETFRSIEQWIGATRDRL